MIYNGEEVDYIAVIYKQKCNQLLDVFTSIERYDNFMAAIENDEDFKVIAIYVGDFIK